ncbi:MAG: NupC/NupG family nucleoside CNT transporter [Planctomycetota bacterium]|jgi:CNT family concentrative nucleoside transporter
MERFASFAGIFILLGIAYLFSTARRKVPWRIVVVGILLQVYLAVFVVRTEWVPYVLSAAAILCGLILIAGFARNLPGHWTPAARSLGILGALTTTLHLAIHFKLGWIVGLQVLVGFFLLLLFLKGGARRLFALAGCIGVALLAVAQAQPWALPKNFVFLALDGMGAGVNWVNGFAHKGAVAVLGDLPNQGFIFAFEVGAIILLFSAILSLLYYVGFLPWLVGLMARVLHGALGVSGAESLAAASNVFVGQTEAPLVIRPYLPKMTQSEVMALMAGGFATIAGSVLGAYVSFFEQAGFQRGAADLIAASVMSAPAAFVFAKLFVPETELSETAERAGLPRQQIGSNALDALTGGVQAGLKLAVNVIAMLLVFYALIYMLDEGVGWVVSWFSDSAKVTFTQLYSYLFAPFAFLMGVPWEDCLQVGELIGTKTIFNEFVAYEQLSGKIQAGELQTRSIVLATYALCGFANFMSIGIQIGGMSQLAPGRRSDFSRLALKAMIAGALACQLTACIVGGLGRF